MFERLSALNKAEALAVLLVELHDPGDPDRVGCRATGRVPFAEVAKHQTVGQVAGRYVVAVSASQMHKMLLTSHGTLPNKDSSSISITFPGPVLSASAGGAISGRTVTWSDASAFPWMALEATADRSSMPDLALPLAVVGSGPVSYTHLDVYKRQITESRSAVYAIVRSGGRQHKVCLLYTSRCV